MIENEYDIEAKKATFYQRYVLGKRRFKSYKVVFFYKGRYVGHGSGAFVGLTSREYLKYKKEKEKEIET